jgi:energy-coupling factor transporter transmembrane protein EcfT
VTAAGFYVPGSGPLYGIDPRVKLWFSALAVGLCVAVARVDVLTGVLILTHVVLLAGGVPVRRLLGVWRALAPLIVVILILQPVLAPGSGPTLIALGPVRITAEGLLTGLRYGLRIAAAAFAVLVPILTTPINLLVRAFEKIGLPYTWALTVGLALRYLGTIGELYETISEAQQARGWDLSEVGFVRRVKGAVPTLIALIVASLRLSDSLALGLAARGFGLASTHRRTTFRDIAFRPTDWIALAAVTAVFAAAVIALIL